MWKYFAAVGIFLVLLVVIFRGGTDVYVHGVAVGEKTAEELTALLMENFQTDLDAQAVSFVLDDALVKEVTFAEFGALLAFDDLVQSGLARNQSRGAIRFVGRNNFNEPPGFSFDPDKLEDVLKSISREIDVLPQNAAFFEDFTGNITTTAERAGFGVNVEKAAALTREILHSRESGEVRLEIVPFAPLYTLENLNFSPTVTGYYSTAVHRANDPRSRNIARAAARINNTMLFPGEVFSAGAVIGANLPDSGYETAAVLVRGIPAEDVGGGVCQVVTTLYNAVLRAELDVVQRHNHSARVSYVELGFDATVAGDYFDLKFKNDTSFPMLITSRVENNNLIVKIHGNETREAGRSLRFEVRQMEVFPPEPYREVVDPSVPLGEQIVMLESQMGYRVELFKHVYMHGVEIEQVKLNSSVYKPLQGVIAIGAG